MAEMSDFPIVISPNLGCPLIVSLEELEKNRFSLIIAGRHGGAAIPLQDEFKGTLYLRRSYKNSGNDGDIPLVIRDKPREITDWNQLSDFKNAEDTREIINSEFHYKVMGERTRYWKINVSIDNTLISANETILHRNKMGSSLPCLYDLVYMDKSRRWERIINYLRYQVCNLFENDFYRLKGENMLNCSFICFFVIFFIALSSTVCTDSRGSAPQEYASGSFANYCGHEVFDDISLFKPASKELKDQSLQWQDKMRELGLRLKHAKVRLIYFVSGTFVGTSPLGILNFIQQKCPGSVAACEKLKEFNNGVISGTLASFWNNSGVYTNAYISLFSQATGIDCKPFPWSSEDNHIARFQGFMELVTKIAEDIDKQHLSPGDRILLIGHSHAGQLFALSSDYLFESPKVEKLRPIVENVLKKHGNQGIQEFDASLQKIKTSGVQLDYVTFGTPVRYEWTKGKYNLLNIINHRDDTPVNLRAKIVDSLSEWISPVTEWLSIPEALQKELKIIQFPIKDFKPQDIKSQLAIVKDTVKAASKIDEQLVGILFTKNGDYVQKLAITDSTDIAIPDEKIKEMNVQLAKILEDVAGQKSLFENLQAERKIPSCGKTILVDYKDNSTWLPNCIPTILGHGVYTQFEKMLFNTKLIVDEMYGK